MHDGTLQERARPHLDVWKVAAKVFLIVTDDDPDARVITVKVEPQRGAVLRRDHESITVGRLPGKGRPA
ncbi:hypothetical protein GCM10009804_58560 [Kribbella hippodromi]|uniref:Uncharacterized protein n=1 Tax=Kribbella hippodromi TaxID=434347 RepID=A0ABP4Q3P7_9ACTN